MQRSSARTYLLHDRPDGAATPHWQYWGKPRVTGCTRTLGTLHPPYPPKWIVRARTVLEACYFANESVISTRGDLLGVWWDRELHDMESLRNWGLGE